MAGDRYEVFYADKLWALIPAMYWEAEGVRGPLRELVDRIGAQAAIIRRSVDRMWEDQSIETCDDWLIPYIGDLLATNVVSSLDARGRRLDVANTIYYRRRAGTIGILEEIAHDVTGWDTRVVEFFRRLSRTRHGLDPEIGIPAETDDLLGYADLQVAQGLVGPRTATPAGGFADLRNAYGAARAQTAFDELFHTADLRAGRGMTGWHDIPHLGVFVWRLYSFGVVKATPVACPTRGLFTFDPTGRLLSLFAASSRTKANDYGDNWVSPREWQLPLPIGTALYAAERDNLYSRSLQVFRRGGLNDDPVDAAAVTVHPELGTFAVTPEFQGDLLVSYHHGFPSPIGAAGFDRRAPGRHLCPVPPPAKSVTGGGALPAPPAIGTLTIEDSLTYGPAMDASGVESLTVRSANHLRPLVRLAGPWTFRAAAPPAQPRLCLEGVWVSGADIVLRGAFDTVRLTCTTLDPGTSGAGLTPPAVLASSVTGMPLRPTRLWVEGSVRLLEVDRCVLGPIRTREGGVIEELHIADSVIQGIRTEDFSSFADLKDAARLLARLQSRHDALSAFLWARLTGPARQAIRTSLAGGGPALPQVSAPVATALTALVHSGVPLSGALFEGVALDPATRAAVQTPPPPGPELTRLNRVLLEAAFPAELADLALATTAGLVRLERVTVLGRAAVHRLEANDCVLDDMAVVEDGQHGCVRFSAWTTGSVLPRRYESVEIPAAAPIFTSRNFGQPGYAQLLADADRAIVAAGSRLSITEGGSAGSEMGAFAREMNAIKRRSLLIKLQEFMPLGLSPVVIDVT